MGNLEAGLSRRSNFWVGVLVLSALCVGATLAVEMLLR